MSLSAAAGGVSEFRVTTRESVKAKEGAAVTVVKRGDIVPPRVVQPCKYGDCPFAGQSVTVIVSNGVISWSMLELKEEFEAATGTRLNIMQVLDDVLPVPRSLLSYGGKKYMVANDHDGQVMYYRRDLLADPRHRAAFQQKYGYPLDVPKTWAQFRDVAEYFNGKDLNGDGVPDHGLSIALMDGAQGMFHFMSFSAPFVIGPDNPRLYWFDPRSMKPLIESPGHVRALAALVDLVRFGPKDMLNWDLGKSWDHFLAGRAALTFTWGDLGALAQQEGSKVKGKTGSAALPGTGEYYSIAQGKWVKTAQPNLVGNTTGGSWGPA